MTGPINNNQKHTLEEALQQLVNAQLQGREPDIEEIVKRYPEHEQEIKRRIRKLHKINNLFDSLVQADESDFEEAAAEQDLVGRKIGSFEITEMIGRGGMGVVYLARDTKLDRSVAVKSIPAKMASDSTARKRFRREAKLLASLNHPNIAVIHEILEEEKSGYLVLEYVPGETLAERIAGEPLTLEQALSIGQQIAKAVSAAHEQGVVHRDLKPSNIKITPDGRVKVLDFGLAKASVIAPKSSEITETQPGRVVGTPAYMSPEQARGKGTDTRTDIWSFGCIMYQMLTGQLPFEGETATDTLARIIEREPDWNALSQSTPANVRALLQRCLKKDPEHRLANIADASSEISETLGTPPTARLVAFPAKSQKIVMIVAALAMVIVCATAVRFFWQGQAQPSSDKIRLAVLPFENLGPPEAERFADSITEEVRTRLQGVYVLRVIARQSSVQYKGKEIGAKQIGEELDVAYIVAGTVRRESPSDPNSPVKIAVNLVNASKETSIWDDEYSGDMSGISSSVAEGVARGLDITLREREQQALAYKATDNMQAYEYYLQGKEYYLLGYSATEVRQSIEMYRKAIDLDPDFAQAHARLSRAYSWMYMNDKTDSLLQMAKDAVNTAFRLDPDLPEAHHALGGFYYFCHLDYDKALEQYEIIRKSQPNNSEIIAAIGNVQRRQGKFEEALVNIKDAFELNPLSFPRAYSVGFTLTFMREYAEAEIYYDRAIKLAPDEPFPYIWKARNYMRGQSGTARAREILEGALEKIEPPERFAIVDWLVNIDVYERKYEEALERLSSLPDDLDGRIGHIPNVLTRALIYDYWDKEELAKEHYELACSVLKAEVEKQPKRPNPHSILGIAYAGLGRKEDAIREGKRAIELDLETPNALGLAWDKELARIYVMVDEDDEAIDKIEYLLRNLPARLSIPLLQLDPAWDPLRNHSRFQELVESGK